MTEEQRQKLIQQRRKELAERELEQSLGRDLALEDRKHEQEKIREKHESKHMTAAIMFFGTLGPLYLLMFGVKYLFMGSLGGGFGMLGISLAWINPLLHGAIWVAAVISVYRKRSVLDDIIDRFL